MKSRRSTPSGITLAECVGCGQAFEPANGNQTRCKPGCGWKRQRTTQQAHQARTVMRAGPREFICIDGEGVTDPETGEHKYVLLSCGDKHLSFDGAALEFGEIATFLWQCYLENPRAIFVGFYLKYDWSQWLRSIPRERAAALLSEKGIKQRQREGEHLPPWPVTLGGWDFDYLYGRRFKLRPHWKPRWFKDAMKRHRLVCRGCDGCKCPWEWLWINDCGSYFQTTLLKAINPDPEKNPNPVCTQEEYDIIAKGKDRRRSAEYDPEMIRYNQLECEVTAKLMSQLAEGMRAEGLRPKRDQWYGPGQLAQLWLQKIKAPTGVEVREAVPEGAREAGRGAYFGGWFEIFWHGPYPGTSYSYDINSAYPFIMSKLPCLLHGHWRHEDSETMRRLNPLTLLDGFQLVRAKVRGSNTVVGAMLHRNQTKTILRPQQTKGWFWGHELKAAWQAGFIDVDGIRLYERWRYAPCSCPPPLAAIADLYEGRIALGKESPAGKARKLIYNSCAGKFQQSVGKPVFGNPIYASAITAGCRAMICHAIGTHPRGADALLMVATDGVAFRWPHPTLEMHKTRLGAWTLTEHENLSLFMPGVYWDDETRRLVEAGEAGVFKSRGIPAKDLSLRLEALDAAWKPFRGWPEMPIPISFQLISPKQALDRGDWSLCGQVSSGNRDISANPEQKRWAFGPGRSAPHEQPKDIKSLAYKGEFGDELRAQNDADYGDHPDGPILQLQAEVLHDR